MINNIKIYIKKDKVFIKLLRGLKKKKKLSSS